MIEQFDSASDTYDQDFTNTLIGRLQRGLIWKYLDEKISNAGTLNILELNCGTGEDALHLAEMGHRVTATDISSEMLTNAQMKASGVHVKHRVAFSKLDITKLNDFKCIDQFDLVFSNFGGVNCINGQEMEGFRRDLKRLLKPNGALIMVIMPNMCLWESFYFFVKLQFSKVFRRNKSSVLADVSGVQVETYYYSPTRIIELFNPEFSMVRVRPIGFFAPPSYMEAFVKRNKKFFCVISYFENKFSRFAWQGRMSDHYFIELQVK
ncbi:MAG: ubiquinone/menaquinone biosynthesis C-methylase UbiE [Roseivirga sp.]|jgi:ubiquinone/menaquinone biosynthesis C-methylase UbiE